MLLEQIVSDAAAKAGVPAAQVRAVATAPVEWPDASLGCPQPGRVSAQVITPGFRVTVEAGGKRTEYHTDRGTRWVTC